MRVRAALLLCSFACTEAPSPEVAPPLQKPEPTYRVARRKIELMIRNPVGGSIDVVDTLERSQASGLATARYRFRKTGPMYRFVVEHETGGHGWSTSTTTVAIDRALDVFDRWHRGADVSAERKVVRFPGSGHPSLYPHDIGIIVRDGGDTYDVEVHGENPAVRVRYSVEISGAPFVEEDAPGVRHPERIEVVRFDLSGFADEVVPRIRARVAGEPSAALTLVGTAIDWVPQTVTTTSSVHYPPPKLPLAFISPVPTAPKSAIER